MFNVYTWQRLAKWDELEADKDMSKFFYRIIVPGFSACNLVFTALCYAYVYDVEGTSKLGWSDMLG